jgi:hypothetical protein
MPCCRPARRITCLVAFVGLSVTAVADERLKHWAWQPISANGEGRSIDDFVGTKLRARRLALSPEGDRHSLIRRLTFDLHGLPPTPEAVEEFVNDQDPRAYEKLVDRLLDSPHYGERFARHWLDIAHYADTHGFERDRRRPNAWPYRDYVIEAFNTDKPYHRFLQEQIAGDVLWPDEAEAVVATGFLAAGPWDYVGQVETKSPILRRSARSLDLDDMATQVLTATMAMTVNCARCHDHKLDPISQQEYYQLRAVFAGVKRSDRVFPENDLTADLARRDKLRKEIGLLEPGRDLADMVGGGDGTGTGKPDQGIDPRTGLVESSLQRIDVQLPEEARFLTLMSTDGGNGISMDQVGFGNPVVTSDAAKLSPAEIEHLDKLREERRALDDKIGTSASANVFAVVPQENMPEVRVLLRGDTESPTGDPLEPGAMAALHMLDPDLGGHAATQSERRAALARWITDPDNPLTARVIVNRLWHWHFGQGLVATPSDFGLGGGRPSHPELLDWLATELVRHGWSLKAMHRLILNSATYRQGSRYAEDAPSQAIDAGNRLLWRQNSRRIEAEEIRDAVLFVSGKLNSKAGGPGFENFTYKEAYAPEYTYITADKPALWRRSIYRYIVRTTPDRFLTTLDCPDPANLTPTRLTTTTPLQSLALFNNDFMLRQARYFAERIEQEAGPRPAAQVPRAFELAFGRRPSERESELGMEFLQDQGLFAFCRALFNANEFVYVD